MTQLDESFLEGEFPVLPDSNNEAGAEDQSSSDDEFGVKKTIVELERFARKGESEAVSAVKGHVRAWPTRSYPVDREMLGR